MSSNVPENCMYTKDHEWVRVDGKIASVGVTNFAQSELGEIVFVELPEVGTSVSKGDTLCVLESTKAASDVYSPITGTVIEVNSTLSDNPTLINSAPHAGGWLVKLEDFSTDEIDGLMSAGDYEEIIGE